MEISGSFSEDSDTDMAGGQAADAITERVESGKDAGPSDRYLKACKKYYWTLGDAI